MFFPQFTNISSANEFVKWGVSPDIETPSMSSADKFYTATHNIILYIYDALFVIIIPLFVLIWLFCKIVLGYNIDNNKRNKLRKIKKLSFKITLLSVILFVILVLYILASYSIPIIS